MNGAQSLFKALVDAGIATCFVNPGTSEMQLVYEIGMTDKVRPILCLQEDVVVKRIARMQLARLMHRYRRLVGERDDRPFSADFHSPQHSGSRWSRLDAAGLVPRGRNSSQPLAARVCGAWRLVVTVGSRLAQRNSFARPTRAIPPLLPGLRGEYRARGF